MGWSCRKDASDVLNEIERELSMGKNGMPSNGWMRDGRQFFYETGDEQEDGGIVGHIYEMTEDGNSAVPVGPFYISPDGSHAAFYGYSKTPAGTYIE